MIQLENWSVVISEPDYYNQYQPPESQHRCLHGIAVNHPSFPANTEVTTSDIVGVNKRLITTRSGSMYELGQPDPTYVQWCMNKGFHIPTEDCPIVDKCLKHTTPIGGSS